MLGMNLFRPNDLYQWSSPIATNPRVARPVGDFRIEVGRPTMWSLLVFPSRTDIFLLGYSLGSPMLPANLKNVGSIAM